MHPAVLALGLLVLLIIMAAVDEWIEHWFSRRRLRRLTRNGDRKRSGAPAKLH